MADAVNEATLAQHMHLVHRIAARFARRLPRNVRREDLVAAGTLGLFNALRSSEHTCEEMFASYARIRIRGAIVDELRRNDWSPRRRRGPELAFVSPSKAPPADPNAPIPVTVVGFDDLPALTVESFDSSSGGASYGTASPFDQLNEKSEHQVLHELIAKLPEREREILRLRYFEGISNKDVATSLGLSEARIAQLHARAVGRLRAMVAETRRDIELAA